jgi:uncharacterized tellurite resistance protein B-like protein
MLDRVLDFFTGRGAPSTPKGDDDFELAVAALLIEAARMDDDFDAAERATIERLLTEKFHLAPDEAHRLVEDATEAVRRSTQLFPFTREIVRRMSPEARVHILEMMWKVAYSDGVLDPHEDMLLRRIAGLIHVPDRDRAEARQRALEKLKALKK